MGMSVRKVAVVALASLALPLIAVITAPSASAAITSRGLLFRYDTKNPASYPGSGTIWKDLSGNGYDVTLFNGANTTCSVAYAGSETCASNGAETVTTGVRMPTMQFYNQTTATTGKYGIIKSGSTLNFGAFTGLSISFYANFGTANGNWDRIIDLGTRDTYDNILVARVGSTANLALELYGSGNSFGQCVLTNGITNNSWAHFAITLDGTNCRIYKNGTLAYTTAYTSLPTNPGGGRIYNYVARSNWSVDSLFSGGIADLAMYNVALNDTEVATNYTEQTSAQLISISSTPPNNASMGGATYSITDTSTAQLTPVHTVDPASTSVCSVSGNVVSFIGGGTCKINITQPGNVNFSAAPVSLSQSFSVTGISSLTFSAGSGATYRQATGLSASVNTAGKVTFYSQGKAIPSCKNLSTTTSATCNWKPSQHNSVVLSVTFQPTNNLYSAVTKQAVVTVSARSGNR